MKTPFYNLSNFPKTMILQDYCQIILQNRSDLTLLLPTDPDYYQELLTTCVIIPEERYDEIQLSYSSGLTMRDVLNHVITNEIKRISTGGSNWKSQNLLSHGYRSKRWGSELEIRTTVGVECYFLNSLHTFFITPAWELFLSRVGDVVITHLLTRPILCPVSNGSYVQICGQSLTNVMIDTSKFDSRSLSLISRSKLYYNARTYHSGILKSSLLHKSDLSASTVADHIFHLSSLPECESLFESIYHVCHSILKGYSQCSIWRTFRAYFMKEEKVQSPSSSDCVAKKRERDNINCSEESRPFKKTRRGKRGGKHRPKVSKHMDKPSKNAPPPLPKEATSTVTVGDRILSHTLRNGLLDMTLARDGYESQDDSGVKKNSNSRTPSKKRRRHSNGNIEKSSGEISFSSTNDSYSIVLPNVDDYGLKYYIDMRTMTTELSDPNGPIPSKTAPCNFLSLACSHDRVSEFLKSICRRVFPVNDIWGSRHNHNTFMSGVDSFVRLHRSESLSTHQITKGFQLSALPWMLRSLHLTQQTQIFTDLLRWIFSDFLVSVLAANFYITEGEGTGTETLYYRKRDWKILEEIGMHQMSMNFMQTTPPSFSQDANHLSQVSSASGAENNSFIPTVRFVPKKSSIRAITNMKRTISLEFDNSTPNSNRLRRTYSNSLSSSSTLPNSALYNCLYVLRHLAKEVDASRGFGVDGPEEAYTILQRYLSSQAESSQNPYFIAVLDLEKCFDSVDTARLYDLLLSILDFGNADKHLIHRYHVTHYIPSAERFITRSIREVSTEDNFIPFRDAYQTLSNKFRDAVIIDGVVYPKITREEMLKLLRQHLFSHVVRMMSHNSQSSQFFTQIRGIPQGSVLSPLLCNLYYGDAERRVFQVDEHDYLGLRENKSVVVRVVDDYIMISTDRNCVAYFLQKVHSLIAPAGGGVNSAKTRVNFDLEFEGRGERILLSRCSSNYIQWCGLVVDTVNLEPSFSRWLDRPIHSSINRECVQNGIALRKMMKRFLKPKCQSIVLDVSLNSYSTVVKNIYHIFIVAALRIHSYMREASHLNRISIQHNVHFIFHCMVDAIKYGAILVRKCQWKCPVNSNLDSLVIRNQCCSLSESKWLGYQAFIVVLSKKKSVYFSVLNLLKNKMSLSLHIKPATVSLFQEIISDESDPLITSALESLETKR